MTRWRLLLIIGLGLILFGCSTEPPVTQGTVADKQFTPAHWESGYRTDREYECGTHYDFYEGEYVNDCRWVDDEVWEQHHTWIGDSWALLLRDCVTPGTDKKGNPKCREGWTRVDETTFHDYEVDQTYPHRAKEGKM